MIHELKPTRAAQNGATGTQVPTGATEGPGILARLAAGEEGAAAELFDRYGRLVWSLATRWTRNRADAEDAVQEILLSVWRSAAAYNPAIASEATFICTIARRRLIDLSRGRKREVNAIHGLAQEESDGMAEAPRREADDADARLLPEMLSALTAKQAHVVRLAFGRGVAYRTIARETGWRLAAVEAYGRSGLRRLRQIAQSRAA